MLESSSEKDRLSAPSGKEPLILVASDGEWIGRSLSSVLELNGYAVSLVSGGRATLETARRTAPDAIFIDERLSGIGGVSVCQALHDDPLFDHATPIFLFATAPAASKARTEAFAAGVWDYCTQPLDVDLLLLKLATYVRARTELAAERTKALFDGPTGLYSTFGFERMAEVILARAVRNHEPIACLVIEPRHASSDLPTSTGADNLWPWQMIVSACRDASRRSDLIGYLGNSRLAILAPETDAVGAQHFANRLRRGVVGGASGAPRGILLRAGFCAYPDIAASPMAPTEMIRRAESALLHSLALPGTSEAVSYDQIAVH